MLLIILLLVLLSLLTPSQSMAVESSGPGIAPVGVGSIPGRLFSDGTVCIVDAKDTSRCEKMLFKVPQEIMKKVKHGSFYGIFDVDKDGDPEVFFDYPVWSEKEGIEVINLLVYKKVGTRYQTYLELQAQSWG
jgi:hypothetical protein